jgi:hypothetical protein
VVTEVEAERRRTTENIPTKHSDSPVERAGIMMVDPEWSTNGRGRSIEAQTQTWGTATWYHGSQGWYSASSFAAVGRFFLRFAITWSHNRSMARTWLLPVAAGAAAAVAIYVVLKRMRRVNYDVLQAEDSTTTACIISAFESDPTFQALAKAETAGILKRDAEDDEKLAAGIKMAVGKGVLDASPPVEPLTTIDVLGKSADAVAGKIISKLGDAPQKGCVFILQGLSGTGKGTTVAKLQSTLPKAVSWSNGNVFRSLTLLAVTKCEKSGTAFSEAALTPTLLGECMTYLKFGKFKDGKFDIKIEGLGLDLLVSEVANTTLKEPKVGKNIPTVAKMTQGEVIKFAAGAAEQMRADGFNVLMEGRAQTLDYVRTPHRFELTLSEPNIIGMRRAAQRMMGEALKQLRSESPPPTPDRVHAVLATALAEMAK